MVSQSVQLSYNEYLSADLSPFIGKWVAVNQNGIVASSKTMIGLIKSLNEKGIKNTIMKKVRNEKELMIL